MTKNKNRVFIIQRNIMKLRIFSNKIQKKKDDLINFMFVYISTIISFVYERCEKTLSFRNKLRLHEKICEHDILQTISLISLIDKKKKNQFKQIIDQIRIRDCNRIRIRF